MGQVSGELVKLDVQPGIFTESTDSNSGTRWVDCDLIRFKNGLAQSLGGWQQQVLSAAMLGVPRSIHDWVALDNTKYVAVGTEKRLYLIDVNLDVFNITPIRETNNLTNPFSTSTAGAYDPNSTGDASFFRVTDTNHGVSVGDIVNFSGFTSPVGGIAVNGDFEVKSVTDANNYVLQGANDASSTVTNGGGTGTFIYEITVGGSAASTATGWGTGTWGDETWDTPRTASTFVSQLRTWSLQNWGEDLIASPRAGAIYVWDKTGGTSSRATEIANAPDTNLRVLVSPENRQIVALGAHNGVTDDPLFVAWSDTEDYTTWLPASGNTAGDKRLDQGSEIVTGLITRVGILIWTDVSLHIMQPTSSTQIFSFRQLGSAVAIAGPSAAADAAGIAFFMGDSNFYIYDGSLRVLPCAVWTKVFDAEKSPNTALNKNQAFSVYCSHNKDFNEVWWFYPSGVQSINDRYVVYNYVEQVWYYGAMERASFHDFSKFIGKPYGFDNSGNLFTHEDGVDADTEPMNSWIESAEFSIADGDQLMHVSKMVPDFDRLSGSVELLLKGRKYPQSNQFTKGPYGVSSSTSERGVRIRARHLAMRITQNALGQSFRMGAWRARMRPDGER